MIENDYDGNGNECDSDSNHDSESDRECEDRDENPASFFFNNDADNRRIVVEVPIYPRPPYEEQLPSGFDPMGSIHLEGRAFRVFANGNIPAWILFTGWFIFGIFAFLTSSVLRSQGLAEAWKTQAPAIAFWGVTSCIYLAILWRATYAKLMARHPRR